MKCIRNCKKQLLSILMLFLLFFNLLSAEASESEDPQSHQILFVLDCSHSVTEEKWQEAVDSVYMLLSMLPPEYEAAVLVYNEAVVFGTEFGQPPADWIDEVKGIKRRGYTNTGLAVETGLGMFSAGVSGEKRIVIISDGEISMKGEAETEEAVALYAEAVRDAAGQNVRLDILLLDTQEAEEQISYAIAETGGSRIQTAEAYLFEQLGQKQVMLGISDTVQNTTTVSLQDSFAEYAEILLVAEEGIEEIQASCQCREIQVIQGERFAVIRLDHPMTEEIALDYTLSERGRVNAYLVKEYRLSAEMCADYEEDTRRHVICVDITDRDGKKILTDQNICGKINICVDGEKCSYTVEQGTAYISYPVEETKEITVSLDFEGMNSRVFCEGQEGKLLLELPPEEPEESNDLPYLWLCVIVTCTCLVFILLLVLLLRAKKKRQKFEQDMAERARLSEERYAFAGKIVVYVLKSADGNDIPPSSINLYRREGKEPFSFAWVKDKCRIGEDLKDADKVIFSGGRDNTLCVRNCGDVTMFNGKTILLRNEKYTVNYEEKLLMIFNNGEFELEIHYKKLKPSEREG